MTDVTDWLRSALDEHERIAHEAKVDLDSHGAFGPAGWDGPRGWHDVDGMCGSEHRHIDTFDPAHVLRTVAAHREILDLYVASVERDDWMRAGTGSAPLRMATAAYWETVARVAAIYRDHPGFDPSWIEERS